MIFCLVCNCTGSENIARTFLKGNGIKDYMSVPVIQGREEGMHYLERFPRVKEREMLEDFLRRSTSYVVVVGLSNGMFKWSEISKGGAASEVEAELIVERFV